jgi:hypothetical protein
MVGPLLQNRCCRQSKMAFVVVVERAATPLDRMRLPAVGRVRAGNTAIL